MKQEKKPEWWCGEANINTADHLCETAFQMSLKPNLFEDISFCSS